MKLPSGTLIEETKRSLTEVLRDYSKDFRGCIQVQKTEDNRLSEGFMLIEDGNVIAAAYNMLGTFTLYQMNALERMLSVKEANLKVFSYVEAEKSRLLETYPDAIIVGVKKEEPPAKAAPAEPPVETGLVAEEPYISSVPYESMLSTVMMIRGVVATALVADGFPIFQKGEQQVDFEHIAVATEDIVRSGTRIATELQLGTAEQIILETPTYKVIIAPISDMFLCVLCKSDSNLGLVRLSIKNVQNNVREMI